MTVLPKTEETEVSTRAQDILGFSRWWQVAAGVS